MSGERLWAGAPPACRCESPSPRHTGPRVFAIPRGYTLAPARHGEAAALRSPPPAPVGTARPRPAQHRAERGVPAGASGSHPSGRPRPRRPRPVPPRPAQPEPPPRPQPRAPRPPTWLSPTQKTRPPRLRHTRAPRGSAAAPQKVKEQREARSRCTVARTSAAGRRPQRAHRYR